MLPPRVGSFLALAFGISWAIAGVGALLGIDANSGTSYIVLAALCMFGPAIAAIVQHRYLDRAPWTGLGLDPGAIRWPYLFASAFLGVCLVPLTFLAIHMVGDVLGVPAFGHVSITAERFNVALVELSAAMGGDGIPSQANQWIASLPGGLILGVLLVSGLFGAFSFNLPFMLGEELGWRGYLYQALEGWSGARRILFTGTVWGLWHAPLIIMGHNYPGHPAQGIFLMVLFCVLLAFLFDWARTRTKSVWAPSVLHGVINGTASAAVLFAWDGDVRFGSPVGAAGFIAITLLAAVLMLLDRPYRQVLFHPKGAVQP